MNLTILISGPRKVQRKLLEKDVQSKSVDIARKLGWWARKFSSPSQRSVPDYLFAREYQAIKMKFAVEFKAPGKTSTESQLEEQQKMRDAGWDVYECDNVEKFKQILFHYENFGWLT